MLECEFQEILKKDPPVARFVRVFPAGRILRPILERFLEVELYTIDQLAAGAPYHHLVLAKVRCGQQLEPVRQPLDLNAVVLPDT